MRHFIDLLDWSGDQIVKLLKEAAKLKKNHLERKHKPLLQGRVLGLIFEKPSLRTRVSFQAGIAQLGGGSIFLTQQEVGLGTRETLPDIARTLSQYVDALVLRTFQHQTILDFAQWSTIPIINALSDYYHPCQALADLLAIQESFAQLKGRTIVFVGDGNNVARSLAIACGKVGAKFILSAPKGYGFDRPFLDLFHDRIQGELHEDSDPFHAVKEADAIYTDVWASMGQENETAQRKKHFKAFQVNAKLLQQAPTHAKVLHCLPAHRGEEVTDEVLEGPQSVVFDQAGNRMHVQKALMLWMFQ